MTLELLLNNLCELAIKNNLVNYAAAGGSIYNLNGETIKDYPFIFISPTDEIEVGENTTTYGLTIFYCDRLLESKDNDTQIYSIATDTISNFLRQVSSLDGVVDVADYSIRVFSETQKMNDSINGAYARVRINVLNTAACAQWFDETGEPIGTYIPSIIKDVNVLDNLASKSWVKNVVAAASISGITPEEFEEILSDYVLEKNFATINGEKITNRKQFTLVDQSAYAQDVQNIYQAISGATPEDYSALQEQVSANTENISTLSAFTDNVVSSLTEQREIIEQLQETDSHIYILDERSTQEDINAVVDAALNSGDTEFAKITLYYKYNSQYVPLHPFYRYRPYTTKDVYFSGAASRSDVTLNLILLGLSKNSMSFDLSAQSYRIDRFVPTTEFRKINGQQIYGTGYGDFALVNSVQNTITGIWSGTQNAYNAITQKDPKVLYVING